MRTVDTEPNLGVPLSEHSHCIAYVSGMVAFQSTVKRLAPEQLEQPGLGDWTIRELVAHALRAITTVIRYVNQPVPETLLGEAKDYFRAVLDPDRFGENVHEQIRDRACQDAKGLTGPLVDEINARSLECLTLLEGKRSSDHIATIAGGMVITEYLRTRTYELTVHTLDLVAASGVAEHRFLEGLALDAAKLTVEIGGSDRAVAVVRALTGRGPGLSVL